MKVLIGYDGSESADTALEELKWAGLPSDAEVLVVSTSDVWTPPPHISVLPTGLISRRVSATMAQLQNQAEQILRDTKEMSGKAAAQIKSDFPDWRIETETMSGDAASILVQKAAGWNADLIVIGSQNRSAVGRFFLGSVSRKVFAEADCSVRVARGAATIDKDAPRRIIAGVDDSAAGGLVVESIARRGWAPDTEVVLLTGIEHFAEDEVPAGKQLGSPDEFQRAAAARLNRAGLKVSTVIKGSDVKKELIAEAEKMNADCIFVGSRNIQGTLNRYLLGSVSMGVVTNASCSVEVVRARAD